MALSRKLMLASGSPRRREILQQIQVPCTVLPSPDVDESVLPGESPEIYVQRLSESKARSGATRLAALEGNAVLGADTTVVQSCAGQQHILGKPAHREEAHAMLSSLLGNEHRVLSAVTLVTDQGARTAMSETRVQFQPAEAVQLDDYLALGEYTDKAGGYAIQGAGAVLVQSIAGSYTNVVGLPVEALLPLLRWAQVPFWQSGD